MLLSLQELFSVCISLLLFVFIQVPADMLQVCKFTYLEAGDPVPYHELGLDRTDLGSQTAYLESCIQTVHKELKRKFKGWLHHSTPEKGVDVSYLKPADGVPLRVWKGVTEIDASTDAVFKKLWNEKYVCLSTSLFSLQAYVLFVFAFHSPPPCIYMYLHIHAEPHSCHTICMYSCLYLYTNITKE